jgi:endonuclease/exonuclease/phosphatase family metal-dependent hydrolase
LLSCNVRCLRSDRAAVIRVIRAGQPDVVGVQEAPRFLRWRTKRAALARDTGLVVVGGPRVGGVALLGALRTRVLATREVQLSRTPRLHRRGLALAVLEIAGARVAVASMHLGLDAAERRRHAAEVLAHVSHLARPYAAPIVVAGEVNEEPGGPARAALAARLRDAYSVFVDPRIEVVAVSVPDRPAVARVSDHPPVLAVLRLPSPR